MTTPGKRVLIIEDDHVSARIVSSIFERLGWIPTQIHDGRAALNLLVSQPEGWDLLFLDLGLPGLDGVSLTERLRHIVPLDDVPIIITSARYEFGAPQVENLLAQGAHAYLRKPFGRRDLQRALALIEPS